MKRVIIGSGIKKIDSFAIGFCPNLTEIIIAAAKENVECNVNSFDKNAKNLSVKWGIDLTTLERFNAARERLEATRKKMEEAREEMKSTKEPLRPKSVPNTQKNSEEADRLRAKTKQIPNVPIPFKLSSTDKKIAGVCGGIAELLGVNSTIVRICAVIGFTAFCWVYILLWLVTPRNDK